MLNLAVHGSDFAHESEAGSEHGRAFELRVDAIRIYDLSGVCGNIHAMDVKLAALVHFYFHYRGDISIEGPM